MPAAGGSHESYFYSRLQLRNDRDSAWMLHEASIDVVLCEVMARMLLPKPHGRDEVVMPVVRCRTRRHRLRRAVDPAEDHFGLSAMKWGDRRDEGGATGPILLVPHGFQIGHWCRQARRPDWPASQISGSSGPGSQCSFGEIRYRSKGIHRGSRSVGSNGATRPSCTGSSPSCWIHY